MDSIYSLGNVVCMFNRFNRICMGEAVPMGSICNSMNLFIIGQTLTDSM